MVARALLVALAPLLRADAAIHRGVFAPSPERPAALIAKFAFSVGDDMSATLTAHALARGGGGAAAADGDAAAWPAQAGVFWHAVIDERWDEYWRALCDGTSSPTAAGAAAVCAGGAAAESHRNPLELAFAPPDELVLRRNVKQHLRTHVWCVRAARGAADAPAGVSRKISL